MTSETDKPKTLESFLRKSEESVEVVKPGIQLTDAQRIRAMANPYLASVARCVYRNIVDSEDHLHDRRVFHFGDGSFLAFEVAYTAAENGVRTY